MFVTDRRRSRTPLPELVEAACRGGADAIQMREHDLGDDDMRHVISTVAGICQGRALLIVNNRPSLALEAGVGLHVPEAADTVPPSPFRFLSRAVHSAEVAAGADGHDALVAGHVFTTVSKPGRPPLGLSGVHDIVIATQLPVIAIGGIDAGNAADVIGAGASGVAVIGAIARAADPEAAARSIRQAVDEALAARLAEEDEGQ